MPNKIKHRSIAMLLAFFLLLAMTPQRAYADELVCPKEEHTHTESCYEHRLVCELEERDGHTHGEECWLVERELICGLEEGAVTHEHGEGCFEQKASCVCGIEESPADPGHSHGEGCFDEAGEIICGQTERAPAEGHTHTAECFVSETVLICTLSTEPHNHTDACYKETRTLVCELEEQEGHHHTDECYERVGGPVCGKEEHTHSAEEDCYSNPYIDVENQEYWDKMMSELEYTGDWATDLLIAAYSQLGYHASIRNFIWNFEGVKTGYARYAHWYNLYRGTLYAEFMYEYWCADYASFCVHYAGIPEDYIPLNKNCANWIRELDERGYFVKYEIDKEAGTVNYVPHPGDLIFFEYNGDKKSDHVGIVSSVDAETGVIHTIEGNHGWAVREDKYDPTNWRIYGFGNLKAAHEQYLIDKAAEMILPPEANPITAVFAGIMGDREDTEAAQTKETETPIEDPKQAEAEEKQKEPFESHDSKKKKAQRIMEELLQASDSPVSNEKEHQNEAQNQSKSVDMPPEAVKNVAFARFLDLGEDLIA